MTRDHKSYLDEWRKKKKEEDPEYFKIASKKAALKRKKLLSENPELRAKAVKRSTELRKQARKVDPRGDLLADARKRAKAKGMEYSICKEDITIPDRCPVLGIPLSVGDGKRHNGSPSIDRVDNSRGYTVDNVRVISMRANMIKNDATLEELKAIVAYMELEYGMVRNR